MKARHRSGFITTLTASVALAAALFAGGCAGAGDMGAGDAGAEGDLGAAAGRLAGPGAGGREAGCGHDHCAGGCGGGACAAVGASVVIDEGHALNCRCPICTGGGLVAARVEASADAADAADAADEGASAVAGHPFNCRCPICTGGGLVAVARVEDCAGEECAAAAE